MLQKHLYCNTILTVQIKSKEICDGYCKNSYIAEVLSPLKSSLNKSVMTIIKALLL